MYYLETPKGICSTCTNHNSCGNLKANSKLNSIIWDCNEFTNEEKATKLSVSNRGAQNFSEHELFSTGRVQEKGLCQNCDNLPGCTIKKPETGIWNCEEYQ